MATHFINYTRTPINLYIAPNISSSVVYTLRQDVRVEIIEEFVYNNCAFHHVKIDDTSITAINQNEYYVENIYINKLRATPDSAPVDCTKEYTPNNSYQEPDWLDRPVDIAYFNPQTLVYKIPISTSYRFINNTNRQQFNDFCLRKGIKKMFDYLSKQYTEQDIDVYKNYFKFAVVEDYEVPLRELARIKALVSCHVKYLNAIPLNTQGLLNKVVEVIKVKPYELKNKIDFIFMKGESSSLFKYYSNDSLNAKFSGNFSFEHEGKNLLQIYNDIIRLCSLNDAAYSEKRNQDYLEFGLDDCKNVVYMTYFDAAQKSCVPVLIGIQELNDKIKKYKYNPLFYLKQIDAISLLDACKVSYTEFIDTYCFFKPDVTIQGNNLEDYLKNLLDMSDEEIYNFVEKAINSMNEEVKKEEQKQFEFLIQKKQNSKKLKEAKEKVARLERELAKASRENRDFNPSRTRGQSKSRRESFGNIEELQSQLATAKQQYEKVVEEVGQLELTFSEKYLNKKQLEPLQKAMEDRVKYLKNAFSQQWVGSVLCDPDAFGAEDNEFMSYLKATQEEVSKPKEKSMFKEAKEKSAELAVNAYVKIYKIYSNLFKCINLCTISEKLLKCLSLLLDMLDISISLTTGALASFSYEEFKTKIIPFMQDTDKRVFYNVFINEVCIKQKDIIEIFIKVTGDRTYADSLSVLEYEQAKQQLIEKLV